MSSQANNRNGGMLITRNERSMPKWVTEQSDRIGPRPPPPPLTPENGHAPPKQPNLPPKTKTQPEPDYEIIEFSNQQYSNAPLRPNSASSGSKTPDNKLKCTLCGSGNPWVTCEQCAQQIFCASCDDMFHKHPKRKDHQRKTIEKSRPPIPPKVLPGQPGPAPPVAPPRRNKRGLMTPIMQRKDQGNAMPGPFPVPLSPTPSTKNSSWQERFGSLPRGLNLLNRPLPEPPKTPSESSRSTTPKSVFDNIQRPPSVALEKIKSKANATLDRMQLLQQRYRQQKEQMERERSGSITDQRQMALQHHQMTAQRANQLGQRGMSSSVFNLNQMNRKQPVSNNGWMNNPIQQAQSMAQLNCANCAQQQSQWNGHNQQHMHMHQDPWTNQLSSQQHLNRSNMSLNVPAGYMMQPQINGMYPPPTFMNQRVLMPQMYPQSYMGGMPVMNPGLIGMPPSTSRAASRAGSRMASPAMSRKSVTLRRKQRSSYIDDEATDDEDSDEDDRRSITSSVSRTHQRRMSSASQIQLDDDIESAQAKLHRNRIRNQRRDSVAKSIHNDWAPGRRTSSSNNNRSADSGFNSPLKPSRIYSDLDSEGSGTRALVQAKIEQKLKEESLKQKQSKPKRQSQSPTPQKASAAVQTPAVKQAVKQVTNEKIADESIKQNKKPLESETEAGFNEKENKEFVKRVEKQECATEEEAESESEESEEPESEHEPEPKPEVEHLEENEIEEDNLGPPPSTPDHEWECEFCTFVNEANTKICSICCKTPSIKPKKAAKTISPPTQLKTPVDKEKELVKDKSGTIKKRPLISSQLSSTQYTDTNNTESAKISNNIQTTKTTDSAHNTDDGNESTSNTLKKKESVEDIWAALDENIQTTVHEVTRKAESKKSSKVPNACSTSVKSASVERQENDSRQSQAREIGTSPPPQNISTQTYDTLPIHKPNNREESIAKPTSQPLYNDTIQEADLYKHTTEELNAALKYCGPDMHPLVWLRDNWPKLIQTVQSLATKYGQERAENTIGTISQMEARDALRMHSGNIWQAVSECIEQRQRKYRDISSKGNFSREDIVTALTTHHGNVELALLDLGHTQLKPFLMRIWGSPGGVENESGTQPLTASSHTPQSAHYNMDKDIHNFLSVNALECMQTPNATGAFHTNNQMPSPFDRPASLNSPFSEINNHIPDNTSSYSADSKDFANSPLPLDESILSNKNVLKDLETLIGNMEHNQQKQNEQVLRSIQEMITNANTKIENEYDSESMRILTKSPINSPKFKTTPKDSSSSENEADVKNFVWQHIQEIVPNLVQQVEMELMEDIDEKLKSKEEVKEKKEITTEQIQIALPPPPPPPIDQDEFLMEEVIKPNIKNASIREVLPPHYVYTAKIATFQLAFDKGLEREHEEEFEFETLEEASRQVYRMFRGPEAQDKEETVKSKVVAAAIKEPVNVNSEPKALSLEAPSDVLNPEMPSTHDNIALNISQTPVSSNTQSEASQTIAPSNLLEGADSIEILTTNNFLTQSDLSTINNGSLKTLGENILEKSDAEILPELLTNINDTLNTLPAVRLQGNKKFDDNNSAIEVNLLETKVQTLDSTKQNDETPSTSKEVILKKSNVQRTVADIVKTTAEHQNQKQEFTNSFRETGASMEPQSNNMGVMEGNSSLIPNYETKPTNVDQSTISSLNKGNVVTSETVNSIEISDSTKDSVAFLENKKNYQNVLTSQQKYKPNKESKIRFKNRDQHKRTTIKDLSKEHSQAEAKRAISSALSQSITSADSTNENISKTPTSEVSKISQDSTSLLEIIPQEINSSNDAKQLSEEANENKEENVTQSITTIANAPKETVPLMEAKVSITESSISSSNKRISKIPVRRTASSKSLISSSTILNKTESKDGIKSQESATSQSMENVQTPPKIEATNSLLTDNDSEEEELYSIQSDEISSKTDQFQSPSTTSEMILVIQQEGAENNSTIAPSTSTSTLYSTISQSSGIKSPNEFIPSGDPTKQNLSELVEDTQRLIKQMKDEISIDDFESSTDEYTDEYSDEYDDEEEGEEEEEDEDWEEEEDDNEYDDITEDITEENEIFSVDGDSISKTQSPLPSSESQDHREIHNSSVLSNVNESYDHSQALLSDHFEQDEPIITETNDTHKQIISVQETAAFVESENNLPELSVEGVIDDKHVDKSKSSMHFIESENRLPEVLVETILPNINTTSILQKDNIFITHQHSDTQLDSENKTVLVSGLNELLSAPVSIPNELETENSLPELPAENILNINTTSILQKNKKLTTNQHSDTQLDSEEKTALVSGLNKLFSAPISIANELETENSLPELPAETVLLETPETQISTPSAENIAETQDIQEHITESQDEVKLSISLEKQISNNSKNSDDIPSTSNIPQLNLGNETTNKNEIKIEISSTSQNIYSAKASITPQKNLATKSNATKISTTKLNEPNNNTNSQTNDDNVPSTSKGTRSSEAKKKSTEIKTPVKKPLTASKIPKPKETPKEVKPKETPASKPQNEFKKKLYTRSKSFSGPSTPIGIASVKTISQKFISPSQITAQTNAPKKYPTVARKSSIVEAINKLTKPSGSTEKPTISSLLKSRTQPRIPKKKYHETCFSDDNYESSTSEEEMEPLEVRQRKLSVPVFRAYPSVQEPEEVNTEQLVVKFMKEDLATTFAEAQIAATLVSMKFPQDVSLWAAKECSDLDHAIALLKQECELCSGTYALNQIVSMLKCTHKCCKQCAKTYFTVQITERSINDCSCPFCKLPELHNQTEHEDENLEYFSNLDIFLKNILEPEVHELFQRKLRDRTLLKDPNFKWCVQCSSGFFARPKQKRLICPDCGSVTCAQCRKPWQKQHEGISCDQYLEWESANDPEIQAKGVQQHLEQNGIDCPKCKFRYSLARGGCMHFTCTQCKYEFCYGCAKPFMMGAKCTISPYCAKLGLHAHHPRNCLFYLRDKLPVQLQILLKNNGVSFEVDPLEAADGVEDNEPSSSKKKELLCPIPIQKETPTGLVDTRCQGEVPEKHAGMCRTHYVEYLTAKVAKAKIDPLPIFDLTDCVQELRRRGIALPERGPWDTDEIYKNMCAEVIQNNIPLDMV